MKTSSKTLKHLKVSIIVFVSFVFFLISCSSHKIHTSEYNFVYKGNGYLVRSSYCPGNPRSSNYLIGGDFEAVDMNQDRIIDKVTKGNISLSEAQEIYDYCLNLLEKEGKLNTIDKKTKEFTFDESGYTFSIKSFSSESNDHFNEFTIVDKGDGVVSQKMSVFVDDNADGNLNEVLKGVFLIKDAQQMYNKTIEAGFQQGKLYKVNGAILVK